MTVTAAQIGWSSYSNFEGPFFIGKCPYVLPTSPTENDELMAAITAAEGGHFDSINMYDAGICSVGLIQWIDAGQHSVDNMLGEVVAQCGIEKVNGPMVAAFAQSGASFKQDASGNWRFFNAAGDALTNDQMHKLFMNGPGTKGSWTDVNKLYAKTWAAAFANVFADPGAQKAQVDYTAPRLKSFLVSGVGSELYDGTPSTGWTGAARAAMVSFAVNLPAVVGAQYNAFAKATKSAKWSSDWVIGLLKQVTFAGPTALWPARYNAIRPVIEKLFGVELPQTAKLLQAWAPTGTEVAAEPTEAPAPKPVSAPVHEPDPFPAPPVIPAVVDVPPPAPVVSNPSAPVVVAGTSVFLVIWNFIMMLLKSLGGKN
jgi:hypothetical protein